MKENLIQQKSYSFALRIIKLYSYLTENKKEYVLSKQILRSGTSIGANVEEALGAQSKSDFIAKLSIAYKEARETSYWIRLMRDSDYLENDLAESILNDCTELINIITAILKSAKGRNEKTMK